MKTLKNIRTVLLFLGLVVLGSASFSTVPTGTAAAACTSNFLTFPAWYRGIPTDGECNLLIDTIGIDSFILKIIANIAEIILQLVGYVSVAFIIYGGFKFITSTGSPEGSVAARKTIINASIGLIISIMSVGIVNLVVRNI